MSQQSDISPDMATHQYRFENGTYYRQPREGGPEEYWDGKQWLPVAKAA